MAEDVPYIVEEEDTPHWAEEEGHASDEEHLRKFNFQSDLKEVLKNPEVCFACMNTAVIPGEHAKWMMHFMWEKLRADLTLFSCFDAVLGTDKGKESLEKLKEGMKKQADGATADKVAWLYSSLVGNLSHLFSQGDVGQFVGLLDSSNCTDEGKLDAVTNLLKSPVFRKEVWAMASVKRTVQRVDQTCKPNRMYKCVFAYWMLSFDDDIMADLKSSGSPVSTIKSFLSGDVKVEKVARISLEVIDNFLTSPLAEDIATGGMLEVIQALEYEKWRDQELYTRITEVCKLVQAKVGEVSNFDMYTKELDSERLSPGYLHGPKFWGENYQNASEDIVDKLKKLVSNRDPETAALACSDLGEIAVLHKEGKSWINKTGAKDQVMLKMQSPDRNLRREALLCCQKIMLNKWQDIQK